MKPVQGDRRGWGETRLNERQRKRGRGAGGRAGAWEHVPWLKGRRRSKRLFWGGECVWRLNKPLEEKKGPIISCIKFELNFNAETLLDLFYKWWCFDLNALNVCGIPEPSAGQSAKSFIFLCCPPANARLSFWLFFSDWYLKILQILKGRGGKKCWFIYLAMQTVWVFTSHVFRYSSLKWSSENLHFKRWIHLCVCGVRRGADFCVREICHNVSTILARIKISQQLLKGLSKTEE